MNETFSCITYFRSRDHEPVASLQALAQQAASEDALFGRGYSVIERFGDTEITGPYEGWLEPRPGWRKACEAASRIAEQQGFCALFVLRSAPIGEGDMFLPRREHLHVDVDLRVAEFPLRSHAEDTSLRSAHAYLAEHKRVMVLNERGSPAGSATCLSDHDLIFRRNAERRLVSAYFQNSGESMLRVEWKSAERSLLLTE